MKRFISVRGAAEHNLKHVDLSIPHHALVVVTGVSGSGKSSLVYDTLFREGQRRYLESFSSYARQFLGKLGRPMVEHISGLAPALAVDQRTTVHNPRSTVGTLTELYDHLRLLYSRIGRCHCPACGAALESLTPEGLAAVLAGRFGGESILVLAPLVEGHRGAQRQALERARAAGATTVRVDGVLLPSDPLPELPAEQAHEIAAVVAEIARPTATDPHLRRALAQALALGRGVIKVYRVAHQRPDGQTERFSIDQACAQCGTGIPEVGPRLFSFNSHYGACPTCKGLGVTDRVAPDLLIADPARTLRQGALVPTTPSGYIVYTQITLDVLDQVCRAHGFNVDIPWRELTPAQQDVVLRGSDRIRIPFGKHPLESRLRWTGITPRPRAEGYYRGLLTIMEEILKRERNKNIMRFVRSRPCEMCAGTRLRREARMVTVGGRDITVPAALPLNDLRRFLTDNAAGDSAGPIVAAMLERIDVLQQLGLGYLQLDRAAPTLSAGEAQRIRLATQVGTRLHGILYVLDEPSVGLHPRDSERLLAMLARLRDQGNSVLVVEHDEATIRRADWLIDIGPLAGEHGGEVLFSGPAREYFRPGGHAASHAANDAARHAANHADDEHRSDRRSARVTSSPTFNCLCADGRLSVPAARRMGSGELGIRGARANNLKRIDVDFKLGAFNVVTGVSGAGKSTLVDEILGRALRRKLHRAELEPGAHDEIRGTEALDKVIEIDQHPIGRTPRSNPATYTKVFDFIRMLFAALPEARAAGWSKGDFSLNVAGGRCEACQGAGVQTVGMRFLGDVDVLCEECGGRRFHTDILTVTYRGCSIREVLEMAIDDAATLFAEQPRILRVLRALQEVGLGYLHLGQPATTLSGGEAQRIKLAAELGRPSTGRTLYILDEPTTGLHAADVKVLLAALDRLVSRGNTVIAVEHDPEFVKMADWVIDLGPEGGAQGGQLVASGSPEVVARVDGSHTGAALQRVLTGTGAATGAAAAAACTEPRGVRTETRGEPRTIELRGVATHNLRDIDVSIPAEQITVITGVSGSGKSSLAFDTLFAEGQRRFQESLTPYARRYLGRQARAEVASAEGLTPTVALRQDSGIRNPRSTVGTTSEIYDYYRVLFARVGQAYCPNCDVPLYQGQCPECGFAGTYPHTARMFSFNHHQGACPTCRGLGTVSVADPAALVTDPTRSLCDGALGGHRTGRFYGDPHGQHMAILRAVGAAHGIDFDKPWQALPAHAQDIAMHGTGDQRYHVTWRFKRGRREGVHSWETTWDGLAGYVNQEYARKHADHRGDSLRDLMRDDACPVCGGARLKPEARAVRFAGMDIVSLARQPVAAARAWWRRLADDPTSLGVSARQRELTADLGREVGRRLDLLMAAGLDYLTLDRTTASLSGGEGQRLRLASQLGADLCGITYVLDEPTVGLHGRDTRRLIGILRELCRAGNTVVVVEHDADVMRAADHIIDLGPGAGSAGGRVMACGSPAAICAASASRTGHYLRQAGLGAGSRVRRTLGPGLVIEGAHANNLCDCDLAIPAGGLVVVTGVSGSGKSTLLFDVLLPSYLAGQPVGCRRFYGRTAFTEMRAVDQSPLVVGPASNVATLTGSFETIRNLYAATDAAQARGLRPAHFSLSTKGGRCEACQGRGRIKVSMDFLADVWVTCDECRGQRYTAEILACTYRGASIAEVLAMTAADAREHLRGHPALESTFELLGKIGLDYLPLGQEASTLSGGERQRLKLARELLGERTGGERQGGVLYIFDEPTTGLHFDDVERLLRLFEELITAGHSLIAIEHHPDVIRAADWVIDLGPEGGDRGGQIVARGTPEEIAGTEQSHTGRLLR